MVDRFREINNKFITDDSHLEYTQVYTPYQVIGPNVVLGRKFTVDVEKEYEKLAQIMCRVAVTSNGDNSSINPYLGLRIFKYIELRCKRTKTVIARQYPETAYYRVESLQDTAMYNVIARSIEPDRSLTAGVTGYVYVPMFFWFSESYKKALPTTQMEEIELYCEVATSNDEIGLPNGVTALDYEFYADYIQPRKDVSLTNSDLVTSVMTGYDYFREPTISVGASDTTATLYLTCPIPSYLMSLQLRSDDQENFGIDRMRLYTNNKLIVDKYFNSNFKLYNKNHSGSSDNAPFINLFAKELIRDSNEDQTDFLTFATSMKPTRVVVDFTAPGTACTLYCYQETLYKMSIGEQGRVDSELLGEYLDNKNFN